MTLQVVVTGVTNNYDVSSRDTESVIDNVSHNDDDNSN